MRLQTQQYRPQNNGNYWQRDNYNSGYFEDKSIDDQLENSISSILLYYAQPPP